jgi:hypothetical protein
MAQKPENEKDASQRPGNLDITLLLLLKSNDHVSKSIRADERRGDSRNAMSAVAGLCPNPKIRNVSKRHCGFEILVLKSPAIFET